MEEIKVGIDSGVQREGREEGTYGVDDVCSGSHPAVHKVVHVVVTDSEHRPERVELVVG